MDLAVLFGLESMAAHRAFIWLVVQMRANVIFKIGCPNRRVGTMGTGVQDHTRFYMDHDRRRRLLNASNGDLPTACEDVRFLASELDVLGRLVLRQ